MAYTENPDPKPNECTDYFRYLNSYDKCDISYSNYRNHSDYQNWLWCGHTDKATGNCTNTYANYINKCEVYTDYINNTQYAKPNTGAPSQLYWNPAWWNTNKSMTLGYLKTSPDMMKEIKRNIALVDVLKGQHTTPRARFLDPPDTNYDVNKKAENTSYDTLKDNIKKLHEAIGKGLTISSLPVESVDLKNMKIVDINKLRLDLDALSQADISSIYQNIANVNRTPLYDSHQTLYRPVGYTPPSYTVTGVGEIYTEQYVPPPNYTVNYTYAVVCTNSVCPDTTAYAVTQPVVTYSETTPPVVYSEANIYSNLCAHTYTEAYTNCGIKYDYTVGGVPWYDGYGDHSEAYSVAYTDGGSYYGDEGGYTAYYDHGETYGVAYGDYSVYGNYNDVYNDGCSESYQT